MSGVQVPPEEPLMPSVAAGGRKLLKVVGIDFEVKLPPTDATKEDRRLICGLVIWIRYIKKTKVK